MNTFTHAQAQKCSDKPAEVISLAKGARAAIINCQLHFNGSKWNCSTLHGEHLFGSFVSSGKFSLFKKNILLLMLTFFFRPYQRNRSVECIFLCWSRYCFG